MRLRSYLSVLLVPFGAVACTAILGDFTASDGGSGDGGNDVNGDMNIPDVPAEAAPDAATLLPLTCKESTGSRIQITGGYSLEGYSLRVGAIGKNTYRAVVANAIPSDAGGGYSSELRAYTVNSNNGTMDGGPEIDLATLPTGNQVFSIQRYFGPNPGFAAIFYGFDQSANQTYLYASRLPDNASMWTSPVTLAPVGNNLNNTDAEFFLIDAATDHYFFAFSSVSGTTQTLSTGEASNGTPATLSTIQTFAATSNNAAWSIAKPGIAFLGTNGFIMLSPNNDGPPEPGTGCEVVQGSMVIPINPMSQLIYFPNAFTNSSDPLKVNASFLAADLTNIVGTYYTGQLAASSLGTIDPTKLAHGTVPTAADGGAPTLKDLFVGGNGNFHFEPVNAVDQFVATSQTDDPISNVLYGGFNFAWWDMPTGLPRFYAAGDGRMLPDVANLANVDATIVALVGSLGQVQVAYLSASSPPNPHQSNPPPSSDLWMVGLGCVKQ